MADDDKPDMVNAWIEAIRAVAASMGISEREAAQWLMSEFRNEADRLEQSERFGTMPENYDPNFDDDHPQFGFRADDSGRS